MQFLLDNYFFWDAEFDGLLGQHALIDMERINKEHTLMCLV